MVRVSAKKNETVKEYSINESESLSVYYYKGFLIREGTHNGVLLSNFEGIDKDP